MGKPDLCICENKDADQLHVNRAADQCLCFYNMDSTIHLLPKSVLHPIMLICLFNEIDNVSSVVRESAFCIHGKKVGPDQAYLRPGLPSAQADLHNGSFLLPLDGKVSSTKIQKKK